MSRKCKHLKLAQKFVRSQRYGQDILIDYTCCEDCGEIFKGTVTFIEPVQAPAPVPQPVVNCVEVEKTKEKIDNKVEKTVPTPTKPPRTVRATCESSTVSREAARKAARKAKVSTQKKSIETKPKPTKESSVSKRTDKPQKKVINRKPPRGDSDLRKNSRKPSAVEAPEGASLGDILRAKYDIKSSGEKRTTESVQKKKYRMVDDPYDDSQFTDTGDDVQVFLK